MSEDDPNAAPRPPTSTLFESVYERLSAWCRARDYAGHDPFDALNSRLFRATPLARSRLARLAWTQLFKRSPVNLRRLALVPTERNAKGTALFALAELARFRAGRAADDGAEARKLLCDLLDARLEGAWGIAWGYNFDWQGRAFYAPRGTPTIVPTAFAVRALVEGARAFGAEAHAKAQRREEGEGGKKGVGSSGHAAEAREYLAAARAACEFVLHGLNRSDETDEEVCFSYTPFDRTRVYNASLLASESLASVGELTGEHELMAHAARGARYAVRRQRADGSWAYGADSYQSWADNFHTAFVLTSLERVRRSYLGSAADGEADSFVVEVEDAIRRGYRFWRESFFLADGWPKYYHGAPYPADAHSSGAAVVALAELSDYDSGALELAERVAGWAVRELFDERGFFYYQRRRTHTVRTPYVRWSQAWMAYALARLIESK